MKIEYTPTHHRREHNASETTLASFLATFKAIHNKLGQKRHRYSVPEKLCVLQYITYNSYSVKFKTCPLKK